MGITQDRSPDSYEFDRVMFATNSSPFLAQFVLQHHARNHRSDYGRAAETILKQRIWTTQWTLCWMRSRLSACVDNYSVYLPKPDCTHKMAFQLTNCAIRGSKSRPEVDLDRDQLPCIKTLGVWWLAKEDIFIFREHVPDSDMLYTKRNFLKRIAALFDPIVFLAPFTIRAKIILQDKLTAGLEWDHELTEPLVSCAWFGELETLTKAKVPGCLQHKDRTPGTITLHTFVDASENAYGALVYARCNYDDGTVSSEIEAAKSRVAPSIETRIPRLELMGAIIGLRLISKIAEVLEIRVSDTIFWSDSVNTLWWIRGQSRDFKPFVANRVGEIQTLTNPEQWRYIPTNRNPADRLSRGMKASDLVYCSTWWRGPEFLRLSDEMWHVNKSFEKPRDDNEMKRLSKLNRAAGSYHESKSANGFVIIADDTVFPVDPRHYSSWLKIRRIQSWSNRFIQNCQRKKTNRIYGNYWLMG